MKMSFASIETLSIENRRTQIGSIETRNSKKQN